MEQRGNEALTVSVVIPTRDAGEEFRQTLEAIRGQRGISAELVVVDSGSSDGTAALAREYGARTISIPPASFNHGETRNVGLREASGDLCVMLVQDAVPAGEDWLANLLAPFSDQRVVGVTGRQIARSDADAMARWEVEWGDRFLGVELSFREVPDWNEFLSWDYEKRLRTAWFNNVCSALRRGFWEKHPFQAVPYAEDVDWAMRALSSGYRIVYNPSACVIHSHTLPAVHRLKRHYVADKVMRKLLQAAPPDPIVSSDAEFFTAVSLLCDEIESMLPKPIQSPNSNHRWDRLFASGREWRSAAVTATGSRPARYYWKRSEMWEHFCRLCEQVWAISPTLEPAARSEVLLQALAQTIGVFAASYHNWCEASDCLSLQMRRLDATLSEGV